MECQHLQFPHEYWVGTLPFSLPCLHCYVQTISVQLIGDLLLAVCSVWVLDGPIPVSLEVEDMCIDH